MIQLNQVQFNYSTKLFSKQTTENGNLHFDMQLSKGENVAISGASGSGKSTLLNLIAGFIYPNSGEIILDGVNHSNSKPYQRPVSMLFQSNNLFNHLSIADNIGLGIKPNLKLSTDEQMALQTVAEQVGVSTMLSRKPAELSGGQQQRVALARCLLRDKPILLLDEPFSALDKALRMEMLALIMEVSNTKDLTLMLVTHQPDEVRSFVDREIVLAG